jgi:5-formyltetrahydrofolate cyclo-ligase
MSTGEYSSSPCLMHELDEQGQLKPKTWDEVKAWRKSTRETLIPLRQNMEREERARRSISLFAQLRAALDPVRTPVVGIYWPFRGEIDVRPIAREHIERGGIAALPVVVKKNAPVEFWQWDPEVPIGKGLFNLPAPAGRKRVTPDVLIVPLLGFDCAGYRLGYGSGYYDRTLAAAKPRPHTIGIAFANVQLDTIYPQPHDIPMSRIVTDRFAFDVPAAANNAR